MYPAALVRTIDSGCSLCQHHLALVRSVRTLGTHGQLETCGHSTGRTHDPVPAVALVELGTFAGTVFGAVAVEHDDRVADGTLALAVKFSNRKYRSKA